MEDNDIKLNLTAEEIDYNISKYFNSFGQLKAVNSSNINQIDTIIDEDDNIVLIINGDYICNSNHSGDVINSFIGAVLNG